MAWWEAPRSIIQAARLRARRSTSVQPIRRGPCTSASSSPRIAAISSRQSARFHCVIGHSFLSRTRSENRDAIRRRRRIESPLARHGLSRGEDGCSSARLERFLRLFTDVRPGEGATALLMFANVFLILCAYYFIKPLREGWISISDVSGLSKMEVKAYTSFGQGLLLIPVVGFYGRLVDPPLRGAR